MSLPDSFKDISTFVLDVDGVLTNGMVYVFDDGQQVRQMNIKDGYALQLAVKRGYRVLVLSGGNSPAVTKRLNRLGITDIFMGVLEKHSVLLEYMEKNNLSKKEILYMGDDMPDLSAMNEAGVPCAPSDAIPEIKKIAVYISAQKGGQGCVREVIELVLKLNEHWEPDAEIASR